MWIRNVPKLIIWEFDETQYDTKVRMYMEKSVQLQPEKIFLSKRREPSGEKCEVARAR